MATQIGTITANNINVTVAEYFMLVRIYQDNDQVVISNMDDLNTLIAKLQTAKTMIENVKKEGK